MRSRSKATDSSASPLKFDTFNSNPPSANPERRVSNHSIPIGTDRRSRLGAAKVAGLAVLASIIVISTVSGFTGSKIERSRDKPSGYASALNQIVFRGHLYLPKIDTPEVMSDYDWLVVDNDPKSTTYGKRTKMHFCSTKGLHPPFNEGDHVWMRFKVDEDCLELLGYDHDN
jgi:hypothetical protein